MLLLVQFCTTRHEIDDTTKGCLSDSTSGTFYHDSLHAQRFQTLITSLFEGISVSNFIGGICRGRGSLLMNFSFERHETTKLRAAKNHGKKFRSELDPSFSVIVHRCQDIMIFIVAFLCIYHLTRIQSPVWRK